VTNIKIMSYKNLQELRYRQTNMQTFLTITKITLITINYFNNLYNPLHQSLKFQIHKTISHSKKRIRKTFAKPFLIIFKQIAK
jgi:hypothetical protein